jgi:hypothetical protein
MAFFKIKLNACILIHPVNNYEEIILKYRILLILHFFPYTQSNQFVFAIPHFFLLRALLLSIFSSSLFLFSSTSTNPTTSSNCFHPILHVLTR